MVAASDKSAVAFALSAGQADDAKEGRKLMESIGKAKRDTYLLMDRAYQDNLTRQMVSDLFYIPVVPPKKNRKVPWSYDKVLYKLRNEVERLFRRIKRFRRVFTRYDKLDIMFSAFIFYALIIDSLI